MESMAGPGLIHEMGDLRERARRDRRATSVPLLIFGAVTVFDAVLRAVVDPSGGDLVLLLLAPAGFVWVALSFRRREMATGVGGRWRPYAGAAIVILALLVLLPLLVLLGVYALAGMGLLTVAVKQRNLYLGTWAVVYGVVGGLESFFVISNRVYATTEALGLFRGQDGYFSWAPSLVYGVLGAALIAAGLSAQKTEVARP